MQFLQYILFKILIKTVDNYERQLKGKQLSWSDVSLVFLSSVLFRHHSRIYQQIWGHMCQAIVPEYRWYNLHQHMQEQM